MTPFTLTVPAPPPGPTLPPNAGWGVLGSTRYLLHLWEALLPDPLPPGVLCLANPNGLHALLDCFLRRFQAAYFLLDEGWIEELCHGEAAAAWDPRRDELHPCLSVVPLRFEGPDCCADSDQGEPYEFLRAIATQDVRSLALYPELPLRAGFTLTGLAAVLTEQLTLPATLEALPLLLRLVERDTGNPWLDVCPACFEAGGEAIAWDDATDLHWLATQWQAAVPHWHALTALSQWVQAAPEARLASIHHWLLAADHLRRFGHITQLPLFPT